MMQTWKRASERTIPSTRSVYEAGQQLAVVVVGLLDEGVIWALAAAQMVHVGT
jgi:hypothetical protein